jgi:4-amino-4-deoxy-L-arabinose transferase-like glycosyltransferase
LKTNFRHSSLLVATGLAVLCLLLYFIGLGRLPLLGPDEPRYVEVAREMYLSGDWITPRLAGIPWFEKPALLYWLVVVSFHLFGVSELASRLGVALLASTGVILVFFFGKKVGSFSFALISALVLASTGFWIAFGRAATFDLPLSVAIELTLFSFWLWAERESDRAWPLLVCAFAMGLAVLAKGLVGILIPGAIAFTYLAFTRSLKLLFRKPLVLLGGTGVFLATAATWYGPMLLRHGWLFIDQFIIAHHFRRYLSDTYRHTQPVYFFALVVFAGVFPWTVWLGTACIRDALRIRALLVDKELRLRLFLWLWILIPLIFFSFSGSKLPGYILPIFPAIALLLGIEIAEAAHARWKVAATSTLVLIATIAFHIVGRRQIEMSDVAAWSLTTLGIVTAVTYFLVATRRLEAGAVVLASAMAVWAGSAAWLLSPGLSRKESIRELAAIARERALPNERLVFYLDSNQGVNFYATDLPLRDARSELVTIQHGDEVAPLLEREKTDSLLLMCYQRWSGGLFINDQFVAEELAVQQRRTSCSPGCDWVLLRVSRKNRVARR